MVINRNPSEKEHALVAEQVRKFIARGRISSRWQPGHRVLRDVHGNYQEINCHYASPPVEIEETLKDLEFATWVAACAVALIVAYAMSQCELPVALHLFVFIALTMSMALLAALLIWAVLGGGRDRKD